MEYQRSSEHLGNCKNAGALGSLALKKAKDARVAEYLKSPLKCGECGGVICYEKKSASKFCSRSCAAFFNTRNRECSHSSATKQNITKGLLLHSVSRGVRKTVEHPVGHHKVCAHCKASFLSSRVSRKCCSQVCALAKMHDIDKVQASIRGKAAVERQMAQGRWMGWSGGGAAKESFPEQFVRGLLEERVTQRFESQKQVSRFAIDFAFPEQMVALEVDGKQHEYPKQKDHDLRRDDFLRSKGWVVFRLKWGSVKVASGKAEVLRQFDEFVVLLSSK